MKMIMSIHNKHIENIKNGTKKYEFRKVQARKFSTNEIFIYATAPISKVVGVAKISNIHIDTPENIWKFTKKFSGVDQNFYYNYYENKNKAIAYEIEEYIEFEQPKELSEFGISSAPQSFVYIK